MQTKWVKDASGGLVLPEYLDQTLQHEAELEAMVDVLRDEIASWNADLKQIDPNLEIGWVPETATNPRLAPGRWHIFRHNAPPTPTEAFPLQHPDGSYREPGSWMFDWLRGMDLWNNRVREDRDKAHRELERARARRKQEEREELVWEIDARLKAKNSPGVLFGDSPWTYRAGAPKAA